MHCDNKPRQIGLQWITIFSCYFQFRLQKVVIFHWKYEYGERSEGRFAWYSHYHAMWCPLRWALSPHNAYCHRRHFKGICLNENLRISKYMSSKCVAYDLIDNMPSLLQVMAWRRIVLVYCRIYASPGFNELISACLNPLKRILSQ